MQLLLRRLWACWVLMELLPIICLHLSPSLQPAREWSPVAGRRAPAGRYGSWQPLHWPWGAACHRMLGVEPLRARFSRPQALQVAAAALSQGSGKLHTGICSFGLGVNLDCQKTTP